MKCILRSICVMLSRKHLHDWFCFRSRFSSLPVKPFLRVFRWTVNDTLKPLWKVTTCFSPPGMLKNPALQPRSAPPPQKSTSPKPSLTTPHLSSTARISSPEMDSSGGLDTEPGILVFTIQNHLLPLVFPYVPFFCIDFLHHLYHLFDVCDFR